MIPDAGSKKKVRSVSYAKWGYVFIAPFFIVFALFQLYPLVSTIYYSFFEYFFKQGGLIQVGPKFVGWTNYLYVFSKDLPRYFGNTIIMWLMGFIPQIVFSLLLAAWFTDNRLKLKCQGFFKTVIYMPNLIMASAFAMLFFALFADQGPVNNMIQALGGEPIRFLSNIWGTRSLVALMNFLMWFGNTTIILMAAMMGISPSMFEAAQIDGATPNQTFWKITPAADSPHPRLHARHVPHWRPADVRRSADFDQRQGRPGSLLHDRRHVSEQLHRHVEELRPCGRGVRHHVCYLRGAVRGHHAHDARR